MEFSIHYSNTLLDIKNVNDNGPVSLFVNQKSHYISKPNTLKMYISTTKKL